MHRAEQLVDQVVVQLLLLEVHLSLELLILFCYIDFVLKVGLLRLKLPEQLHTRQILKANDLCLGEVRLVVDPLLGSLHQKRVKSLEVGPGPLLWLLTRGLELLKHRLALCVLFYISLVIRLLLRANTDVELGHNITISSLGYRGQLSRHLNTLGLQTSPLGQLGCILPPSHTLWTSVELITDHIL